MASILDTIKEGQLPELPVSLEKSTIIYMSLALFLTGVILILFARAINK